MRRWGQVTAVGLTALAVIAVAGCGGADEATTTTPATTSAGGPSSVGSAAQARMTKEAYDVVNTRPGVPICDPGGLSEAQQDEETCQWFWNHLLAWKQLGTTDADLEAGPTLEGAPSGTDFGSMIYKGFTGELGDEHYWGPDLPEGCEGNKRKNPSYCVDKSPGLRFGKSTNIETIDRGTATQSTVEWKFTAGDVALGNERFTAYNDGGPGGEQWAFCRGSEWVSCSRANASNDGADINTTQPEDEEDYASYGWVIEAFPVLIRVRNRMPDSVLTLKAPLAGTLAYSAKGSSPKVLEEGASMAGSADNNKWVWLAGFRKRAGSAQSTLEAILEATGSSQGEAYDGATVKITADFKPGGQKPSCVVVGPEVTGDNAKCETTLIAGGVSSPGVLSVTILRGSAPAPTT